MSRLLNPGGHKTGFTDVGMETMAMICIKLVVFFANWSGATVLPVAFVRECFELMRRGVHAGKMTLSAFINTVLPLTSSLFNEHSWFDDYKFNHLPVGANNTDLVLHHTQRSRTAGGTYNAREVLLAATLARRCLNESLHLEYTLRCYANKAGFFYDAFGLSAFPLPSFGPTAFHMPTEI